MNGGHRAAEARADNGYFGHALGSCVPVFSRFDNVDQPLAAEPQATKAGFSKLGLPYSRRVPSAVVMPPFAASRMAWAAATSHSHVGPKRGYKSAAPSATRQNLIELPA
ncbi:hypothetical protein D3C86_1980390 [compost metagenome]